MQAAFYHRYHNYVITTLRGVDKHSAQKHFSFRPVDFVNLFASQGYKPLSCYYTVKYIAGKKMFSDMKREKFLRLED